MRKEQLVQLLQDLPGNPEIVLWNGYVGDFMKVSGVVEGDLVKMTKPHFLEMCRLEKCCDNKDWNEQLTAAETEYALECHKRNYEWEVNEYITTDDIKEKRYSRKRVVYINAAKREKTMHDRLGAVSY